jgi:hypothetical protein
MRQVRGIMRCKYAIGETYIGEIAAHCVVARVDLDRTARQRESVTRMRIACW